MNNVIVGLIPYGGSAALLNALDVPFLVNMAVSAAVAAVVVYVINQVGGPIT